MKPKALAVPLAQFILIWQTAVLAQPALQSASLDASKAANSNGSQNPAGTKPQGSGSVLGGKGNTAGAGLGSAPGPGANLPGAKTSPGVNVTPGVSPALSLDSLLECENLSNAPEPDRIVVKASRRELVLLDVFYKRGIGSARLAFNRNYNPACMQIKFHNFGNLEFFAVATKAEKITTSLNRQNLDSLQMKDERFSQEKIKLVKKEGASDFTVKVPIRGLLIKNRELKIEWIDWYR